MKGFNPDPGPADVRISPRGRAWPHPAETMTWAGWWILDSKALTHREWEEAVTSG
ncbi:hypothetical protein [Desulfobacter vibrioformis]|uniref:hypothetical protein n=1 Tax=Desulfobacter vibrioformis TaxID=34031 RepID=UPI0012EB314F|nr:hypothetical protein [Desulfobacter vibrioformis]